MNNRQVLTLIAGLLILTIRLDAQNRTTIELYHGVDRHEVAMLPNTNPPLVLLNDVLNGLGLRQPIADDARYRLEINRRPLVLDPASQKAIFKNRTVPFPIRKNNGELFVRIDALTRVFSELLGRTMIYERTSRSMHVPKSERLHATLRMRKTDKGYRLLVIYSQAIKAPRVERAGRNLIVKIRADKVVWDRSDFEPNEAVTDAEIFEDLPDRSTEILFKIGEMANTYQVEPFNPQNPRTVISLVGKFEEENEAGEARSQSLEMGIRRIVIDPGHGGVDQGAKGPSGLKEKEVTLDLARTLKNILEARHGYQVALTRKNDTFLSLKARTGVANNFKADLFLSIHVNAIRFRNATGSETYYLTLDSNASFDDAHYDEFKDQQAGNGGGDDLTEAMDDDLSLILWDMAQTKHIDDSFRVAKYLQEEMNDLAGIKSRGVKQAPLKVLKGAMMPAVLLEVAFITNPREEQKLKSPLFRERIVEAISRAVLRYDRDVQIRARGKNSPPPERGTDELDTRSPLPSARGNPGFGRLR